MIQELESGGVKFQKTPSGDYDVKKVHHKGSYVLPMPEGYDIKKILTRVVRQTGVKVENRVMGTRVLLNEGRAVGAAGFKRAHGRICGHSSQGGHYGMRGVRKTWSSSVRLSHGHV